MGWLRRDACFLSVNDYLFVLSYNRQAFIDFSVPYFCTIHRFFCTTVALLLLYIYIILRQSNAPYLIELSHNFPNASCY